MMNSFSFFLAWEALYLPFDSKWQLCWVEQSWVWVPAFHKFFLFKRFYLFNFRGKGMEKERERNSSVWLPLAHPLLGTWPTHNPGMCSDWELNLQPFGLQAGNQSTEPHQPGLTFGILVMMCLGVGLFASILLGTFCASWT